MSDLIEMLRSTNDEIDIAAADRIERLEAERETWDGHKVCKLLRSDLANAIAKIERLEAALTYIAYPQYDDRKYELMAAARAALEGGDE